MTSRGNGAIKIRDHDVDIPQKEVEDQVTLPEGGRYGVNYTFHPTFTGSRVAHGLRVLYEARVSGLL